MNLDKQRSIRCALGFHAWTDWESGGKASLPNTTWNGQGFTATTVGGTWEFWERRCRRCGKLEDKTERNGRAMVTDFIPAGGAAWQADDALVIQCPTCGHPIYTQRTDPAMPGMVRCVPAQGHYVTWRVKPLPA